MLLSDALKKPRKKASKQTSAPTPVAPPPVPVATAPAAPTTAEVTSFLQSMWTDTGGKVEEVQYLAPKGEFTADVWSAEPRRSQGLPDDEEDYGDYRREYAGPLKREVQAQLEARFGKGMFFVHIGQEGYIEVQRA